ncbi:unnamed protein product [Cylindrotheca closterium]|uniref:Kinesin light chain n=1 Tax=Cylindrotheca closterium TaxID=2856 RepID=A0AAD2FBD1_9STRA|nr:unnamed protein product [Cylindrotheca closterium]
MHPPKEDDGEGRKVSYASDYLSLSDDELSLSEFDFKVDEENSLGNDQLDDDGPDQASTTVHAYHNIALAFVEQDKPDQAIAVYKKALKIQSTALGPDQIDTSAETAEIYYNMARAYAKQGKGEKAKALFQRAFSIYCRTLGPHHPSTVKTKELMEWMRQEDAEDQTSESASKEGKTTKRRKERPRSHDSDCMIS